MPLTQEEYLKRFRRIIEVMYETTEAKNNDYAEDADALANFNEFGSTGILIRISDKFKRIKNCLWFKKTFRVKETIIDTMIDLAVYAVIMIIAYEYEQEQKHPLMAVQTRASHD
jgi:hypothetical protein